MPIIYNNNPFHFLGTPPRLRKSTISLENLQIHKGDDLPVAFSFLNNMVWLERENIPQLPCHMTHTNDKIHQIILDNMHQNRHVTEEITGPRYCPSIESKVIRFGSRHHQIWLEPEGFDNDLIYPQGNQIYLVTLRPTQLTQASFLQKNQMLQNVFLIFLTLR